MSVTIRNTRTGDIDNHVLRFQLREGFEFCGVIDGYLPEEVESCGYAALIARSTTHSSSARR